MNAERMEFHESQPAPFPAPDGPVEELFDWPKIYGYVRFALRSTRRRIGLFVTIWVGMVAIAAGALKVLPRTYEVQTRIMAQKNPVLAVRGDSNQWDVATRSAAETILSRDNLHELIRETNLVAEWPKSRAPILRLKDWVTSKLSPPPNDEDRMVALTGLLEKMLTVWTSGDGTVTIKVTWRDPVMACRLVDAAQQNYLESRHVAEISTIGEQISILEAHAAKLKADVDKAMVDVKEARERSIAKGQSVRVAPVQKDSGESPEVIKLRVMLEAKRRAISDLDEFRRHHLTEQQTRLTELTAIYSENNPAVANLRQSVDALQKDSPQMQQLRAEEAELARELALRSGAPGAGFTPGVSTIPRDMFRVDGMTDDPALGYAGSQLQFASLQYALMRERIANTRLDLDTARAAFRHRYAVITPAEIPKGPIKPNALLVMLAAAFAGVFLGIFGAVITDLRSGVLLDRWQLDRLFARSGRRPPVVEAQVP